MTSKVYKRDSLGVSQTMINIRKPSNSLPQADGINHQDMVCLLLLYDRCILCE